MYSIDKNNMHEYKIKSSVFKSYIYSIQSLDDIKEKINSLKLKHLSSSHICYAYRYYSINNTDLFLDPIFNEFYNDDGEPSGTAGKPILNVIKKYDLVNVVLIVVRYYGGIKLGIRGLIDAYSDSAKFVVDNIILNNWTPKRNVEIIFDYKYESIVNKIINCKSIQIINADYSDSIKMFLSIDIKQYKRVEDDLSEKSNGTIHIEDCIC